MAFSVEVSGRGQVAFFEPANQRLAVKTRGGVGGSDLGSGEPQNQNQESWRWPPSVTLRRRKRRRDLHPRQ